MSDCEFFSPSFSALLLTSNIQSPMLALLAKYFSSLVSMHCHKLCSPMIPQLPAVTSAAKPASAATPFISYGLLYCANFIFNLHHQPPGHKSFKQTFAKFYNHGEGPYLGLLLVESASAFTFKTLFRHYAKPTVSRHEIGTPLPV